MLKRVMLKKKSGASGAVHKKQKNIAHPKKVAPFNGASLCFNGATCAVRILSKIPKSGTQAANYCFGANYRLIGANYRLVCGCSKEELGYGVVRTSQHVPLPLRTARQSIIIGDYYKLFSKPKNHL